MSLAMGEGNRGAARQCDTGVTVAGVRAAHGEGTLPGSALVLQS